MPLTNSIEVFLHWDNRVEGIVHATSAQAIREVSPFSAGQIDRAERAVRHPMVELRSEGHAVLSLAQLKGLLHTLEAEMMKDDARADG